MGRPLRKDRFGTDVIGTFASNTGVRVDFWDGSTVQTDGIIIKQRGAKTFVVARVGTPLTRYVAVLQSTTPNAAYEMQLMGYIGGNAATATPLAKITKRIATDFNGVRYKWYLENDSSNDYIVLQPL
jgi:hypothetical protein